MVGDESTPSAADKRASGANRRPRYRLSKWIYGGLLVLFLATGVMRIWWGRHADAKLQAVIDGIRARGEPLEWREFAPEPLPPDQDAAVLYRQVMRESPLLSAPYPADTEPRLRDYLGLPREKQRLSRLLTMIQCMADSRKFRRDHPEEMRAIVEASRGVVTACRRAGNHRAADWEAEFQGPPSYGAFPEPHFCRSLAEVLAVHAFLNHRRARDSEALALVQNIVTMADKVDSWPHWISHLIAVQLDRRAIRTLEEIAPALTVRSEGGAVTREQVNALVAVLLDDELRHNGRVRAKMGQRSLSYDMCERFRRNEDEHPVVDARLQRVVNGLCPAMWKLDEARCLAAWTAWVQGSKETNLPAASRVIDRWYPEQMTDEGGYYQYGPIWYFTHLLSEEGSPFSEDQQQHLHFEALASRRMGATALAIRLYELDHGARPEALKQLVPEYLPAVPDDPFTEGGQIRYRPDRDKPVLYSVHIDGEDDGGANEDEDEELYEEGDWVFFLNGDRPAEECEWEDPDTLARRLTEEPVTTQTRPSTATSPAPPASPAPETARPPR